MVAARKVRAADRTPEQHIADERDPGRLVHEHDVPRCVARTVHDVERLVAEADGLAVLQPAVGHERLVDREVVLGARLGQPLDQKQVVPMGALDLDAVVLGHRARGGRMVDMAVGQQDLGDLDALLVDRLLQHVEVPAGIDGGTLHGLGTPDDGAVLLERRDGRDHDLQHGTDVMAPAAAGKGVCWTQ